MHVTVLIPVYNRERYIEEAIDSVIAQDYSDWDILVVDDGSSDRTVAVVKSKMSDDRIQLIQMTHEGCAAVTAKGIEHARGPVITNLDSDDKLMPNALSAVLPAFEKNHRLGYAWTNYVNSTGEKGVGDFLPYGKTLFEAIISGWFEAFAERFFRKEFYLQSGGLDVSIKYAVDMQLALLIGRTGCDTLHIPKVTYWRRVHPHRISVEHLAEQSESTYLLRRKFSSGNATLTELYIAGLENEINECREQIKQLENSYALRYARRIPFGSQIRKLLGEN